MSIINILGSSRVAGNTELLAEHILKGTDAVTVRLKDKEIRPITDWRHEGDGFPRTDDDYEAVLEEFLKHDHIIFSTPVYWYGMSGLMKVFIDRWSQYLRDERFDFRERMKGKTLYLVTAGGDNPKIEALPMVQQFQYIANFFGSEFGGYIIGKGNRPGEIEADAAALKQAELWNNKFKSEA